MAVLLALVMLLGVSANLFAVALDAGDSPANHLIVQYDFEGDSAEEQLRNKATDPTTGALTLGTTAGLSYIKDGVAHIDSAKGNYLTAALGSAVQKAGALTVVARVKISGSNPLNLVEIANIGSADGNFAALRWSANTNNTIGANGFSGVGTSSGTFETDGWLNLAVTLSYADGNATVKAYRSTDGIVWTQTGTLTKATANQIPNAKNLILGKFSTGMSDRGRSFDFDEFRIYNAALTAAELGTVGLTDLMAVYDFEQNTACGLTATNVSFADGCATIPQNGMLSTASLDSAIKASDALTLFMECKADYILNSPAWHNLFFIGNVARVGVVPATGACQTVQWISGGAIVTDPLCDTDPDNEAFAGDWIRLAYVIDGSAKTVTLYWSADGGKNWTSKGTTFAGDFSKASGLQIGHNISRGLSLQVNEVRLYSAALSADAVKAIEPAKTAQGDAEANLKLHYDFIGSTAEEKLTDKVSGLAALNLADTGVSGVQSGIAHIDAETGNYLLGSMPNGTTLAGADGMTLMTSFRVDEITDGTSTWQPVLRMDGTVLFAINPKARTLATAAGGTLAAGVANGVTEKTWTVGTWITLAAVLRETAAGVQETLYFTYDDGATWYAISAGFTGQTLSQSGKDILFGKNGQTLAGTASFSYRDLRVYDAPLSLAQIKAVGYDVSPDLTVDALLPGEELSLAFVAAESALAGFAKVTAHATFRGRTVELVPETNGTTRVWRWNELTTLTLSDPISVTLTAKTADGRILHGETVTVTAREAILSVLNDDASTAAQKRWCVDLLRYAAAVQQHFRYQTDSLATAGLTAEQLALGGTGRKAVNLLDPGFALVPDEDFRAVVKSTTLSLTFATRLDFFIRLAEGEDRSKLTLVIRDADGELIDALSLSDATENAAGLLVIGTKRIGDGNYDKALFVTVYENFGDAGEKAVSDTVRYSIESYIACCLEGTDADLAAAMLNWSDAIRALRT